MTFKQKSIILCFIFTNIIGVIFSQSKPMIIGPKESQADLKSKLLSIKHPSKILSARENLYLASIFYYIKPRNNDSVAYYLNESFYANAQWHCYMTFKLDKLPLPFGYFIRDFSKSWWIENCKKCQALCGDCLTNDAVDSSFSNLRYDSLLIQMEIRDQCQRKFKEINWKLQDSLDYRNRALLDSLYNVYGFPSKGVVSKKAQTSTWLVLQHSIDCHWNQKWIQYFIDDYLKYHIPIGFLDQTINRFYNKKDGYCRDGSLKSEIFISQLKEKYPKKIGILFGYWDY